MTHTKRNLTIAFCAAVLILVPYKIVWNGSQARHGPPFPFKTYQEAFLTGFEVVGMQECPDGGAVQDITIIRGDDWVVISSAERDIFIHRTGAGEADHVYMTRTVSYGNDPSGIAVVEEFQSVQDAVAKYPTPCDYLYPKTARP